jgi:hypothetical protein
MEMEMEMEMENEGLVWLRHPDLLTGEYRSMWTVGHVSCLIVEELDLVLAHPLHRLNRH